MLLAWVCGVFASGWASPTASADSWRGYRGDGDGKTDGAIVAPDATATIETVWKIETPLGFSSFAVDQGIAFTVIARDGREILLAVDAETGQPRWERPLGTNQYNGGGGNAGAPNNRGGDGPRSTPTVAGDLVYVYDAHLKLWAFNVADGREVWTVDVQAAHGGRNIKWSNASSPVVDDDRVFVSGGGTGQTFLCFDGRTGEVIWKTGDDTMTHSTPTLATIHGKRQVVFWMKSGLVSLDVRSGQTLWSETFPFSTSTAASPVIDGNRIYCSAGYGVGAGLLEVSPDWTVKEVWFKANDLMNHWSTPVAKDGYLYGIFGFKKYGRAPLQCVEMSSGKVMWSQEGFGPGNVIVVGDVVVALSDAGRVVLAAARPDQYREIASDEVLDGKCWSTPAYADGKIFVRSTVAGACLKVR